VVQTVQKQKTRRRQKRNRVIQVPSLAVFLKAPAIGKISAGLKYSAAQVPVLESFHCPLNPGTLAAKSHCPFSNFNIHHPLFIG
jgi:hypothetical protein